MLLTLRGTPFLYQGDELGMTNYPFTLEEFNDIEIKNGYKAKVLTGQMPEAEFLAQSRRFGRDNARTPMQWDSSANAGFCSGDATPWLVVNPNYKESMQRTNLLTPLRFSITPSRWSPSTGTIWPSPMVITRISTLTIVRSMPIHVSWAKLDS
jgi:glycosidase